jgi:phosphohistidine phosphatase
LVTLVVLRHAKSAWPDGVPDLERPLGERGLRDAPAAGRWLNENVPTLDLAVVSPAARARMTWSNASAELDVPPRVHEEPRMYFGPLINVVQDVPADIGTAVLVGHNPDLEHLAELLTGEPTVFKTSTIAVLRSELAWADAGPQWADLVILTTPRG